MKKLAAENLKDKRNKEKSKNRTSSLESIKQPINGGGKESLKNESNGGV